MTKWNPGRDQEGLLRYDKGVGRFLVFYRRKIHQLIIKTCRGMSPYVRI